jgi:FemAB-related protein (PEP-CTERM system-associated)
METRPMENGETEEWRRFVASSPSANYCMDPAWRDVIAEAYGKEPSYWICREGPGQRVIGVAAAFWMDSLLFGRKLVGLPYLDYGGILAESPAAEEALLGALGRAAAARGARLELRQDRPLAGLGAPANRKVRMELDLRGRTVEGYWNALDAKVRNQIRKAERSRVTVRAGREELLDGFYRVFCVNMRDLGSPVHSLSLFRSILRRLPGAELAVAEVEGWCVGGLLRIHWGDAMAVPWASTLRAYRGLCPNNALYWDAVTASFRRGCARLDFGRSTRGEGTWSFKRQWLAEEGELPWYGFAAPARVPAGVETAPGRLMAMASALWSRLPARYANLLGPPIRAAIPN